jgi:E3 ubiquitin-protein ligase RNF14
VKCLDPDCGKTRQISANPGEDTSKKIDQTLQPSELLQIEITQEQVKRYIELKHKSELESDKHTIYCPRKWCQGPARASKASSDPSALSSDEDAAQLQDSVKSVPPAERLAICEDCSYAFCRTCEAGWHGELQYCRPQNPLELTPEERASEEYIRRHSSPCPTCGTPCQKSHGCNHMICFRCSTHFCYLCSAWLNAGNPFQHFNSEGESCYMRLWELEDGDGGDVEMHPQFRAGQPVVPPAPEHPMDPILHRGFPRNFDDDDNNDNDDELDEHEVLPLAPAALPEAPAPPEAAAVMRAIAQRGPRTRQRQQRPGGGGGRDRGHIAAHLQYRPQPQQQEGGPPAQQGNPQGGGRGHGGGRGGRGRGANPNAPGNAVLRPAAADVDPQALAQQNGLRRFLEMVERDEEDEWDSDELSEDGDEWDHFR